MGLMAKGVRTDKYCQPARCTNRDRPDARADKQLFHGNQFSS